jgi:hypothetical protein
MQEFRTEYYIKVCGGSCGRFTRPPWMAKHVVPGTVQRASATECHTCYRARQRQEGTLPPPSPRGRPAKNASARSRGEAQSAVQANAEFLAARNRRLAQQQRKRVA